MVSNNSETSETQYRIPCLYFAPEWPALVFRGIRAMMGKSQSEMAMLLGVTSYAVQSIESRRRDISPELAISIQKVFEEFQAQVIQHRDSAAFAHLVTIDMTLLSLPGDEKHQ